MATQYAFGKIVTNGLVLALNAADKNSYLGSGTAWNDLSGNGNNGTLTNSTTFSTESGGNILFNGTDSYTAMPLVTSAITNITMQVWVKIILNSRGTFMRNGGNTLGYSIGIGNTDFDNTGNNIIMLFSGIRWIATGVSYATAGWKLVTMTLNASSVPSAYINDTLIGSYAGSAPGVPTIGTYLARCIGDETSPTRAYGGNIACAYFYNRVLSATEIAQNYNTQKSRFGLI
jgi:hypothetical protein